MAVKPQRRNTPGVMRADGRPSLRSAILWDNPEMRLSLGDTGLMKFVPKLWVPVASASGVELPAGVDLQRASASDAADGLVFSGVVDFEPPSNLDGDGGLEWQPPPPAGPAGGDGRWTDEERAALRLPPSR